MLHICISCAMIHRYICVFILVFHIAASARKSTRLRAMLPYYESVTFRAPCAHDPSSALLQKGATREYRRHHRLPPPCDWHELMEIPDGVNAVADMPCDFRLNEHFWVGGRYEYQSQGISLDANSMKRMVLFD